jgi:hypothetical protein
MKKILWVALSVIATACGGGSPTAPSQLPAARIVGVGQLTQSGCSGGHCSFAHFEVKNEGPGCASTTDLAGTVSLFDSNNVRLTEADWELTLDSKTHGGHGIFRPGEIVQARATGSMTWVHDNNAYNGTTAHSGSHSRDRGNNPPTGEVIPRPNNTWRLTTTRQTNVACQ